MLQGFILDPEDFEVTPWNQQNVHYGGKTLMLKYF